MTDLDQLRQTSMAESDAYGNTRRFGLFSQPISVAIGDNGPYIKRILPKNELGKPVTQPRNFQTTPLKSGKGNEIFFEPLKCLASSTVKDEYIEEGKRLIRERHQRSMSNPTKKDKFFEVQAVSKSLMSSAYPYQQEKQSSGDPRRNREADGKVRVSPINIQTNPQSKVVWRLFKNPEHLEDQYSRKHQIELERAKQEKAKEGEAAFRPNKFRADTFSPNKQVYEDFQIKKELPKHKPPQMYRHERQWRRTVKNGYEESFSEFPYMPNPIKETTRAQKSPQSQRDIFKSRAQSTLAIPSPSITTNLTNLRRSLNLSKSFRN